MTIARPVKPRAEPATGDGAPPEDVPALECRGVSVRYGETEALREIHLDLSGGQVLALLGPSGAGKTTLLATIAGFLQPAAGQVLLEGRVVAEPGRAEPPERRSVGMLFQNYALWPHMTVLETVTYPLRRLRLPPAQAREEALRLLERMQLATLSARRPAELSGGEQQRVALARALARRARLYLFDEPTAHMDGALREAVQAEIVEWRRETGAAAVYATHDSGEALAVADVVALLRGGRLVHRGTPQEVYERPIDMWAARLTGPVSVLRLERAVPEGGEVHLSIGGHSVTVPGGAATDGKPRRDRSWEVLVRPDWTRLGGPLPAVVRRVRYRGPFSDYELETEGGTVLVRERGRPLLRPEASCGWTLQRVWLVPAKDG